MNSNEARVARLDLYDDGNHNDNAAGDNIWGATWGVTKIGAYHLEATVDNSRIYRNLRSFNIIVSPACVAVVNNGGSSQKLDIVYIAEQYGGANLATFRDNDVVKFKNKLLAFEPFKAQSNKINFWRIDNTDSLGCHNNCGGINRAICCDRAKVLDRASSCNYDKIGVIVNSSVYGGGGAMSYFTSYNGNLGGRD
ncbi:MAG TPA: M64 family metallopeptidase, partial [Candidatus Babeliales bacterium]|nr:M64 family metallopeptidase [Candidatus Babeliales bacterium]